MASHTKARGNGLATLVILASRVSAEGYGSWLAVARRRGGGRHSPSGSARALYGLLAQPQPPSGSGLFIAHDHLRITVRIFA